MAAIYTTGTWIPYSGMDADFVRAWTDFARWASIEGLRDWNRSAEFLERIAHVLQHVDEFHPFELRVGRHGRGPELNARVLVLGAGFGGLGLATRRDRAALHENLVRRGLRGCSHISLVMDFPPGPRGKPEPLGHVGARITAEWNARGSPHSGNSPAKRPIPAPKIGSSLRELPFATQPNPHPKRKSVGQGMGQRPACESSQRYRQPK